MARMPILTVLAFCLMACSEPFVSIPGGELPGVQQAPPETWSDVPETIQLETRPQDPYSVNIWGVGLGRDLYIATDDDEGNNWTEHIAEDNNVRVRIDGRLHHLKASLVQDAQERGRVAEAYFEKYGVDYLAGGMVFRLDRP